MSVRWEGDYSYEQDSPSISVWVAAVVWIATLVVMFGAAGLLSAVQGSDESPTYTCAPGEVYTTKECP